MPQTFTGKAIVAHAPLPKDGWKIDEVTTTADLKDDELVVEMVASGICHTDVLFGTAEPPFPATFYPRVLGHEGSGYVRAVGPQVRNCAVGDPVLLSYNHCRSCTACKESYHTYCESFAALNFGGHPTFALADGTQVPGSFFGPSSFAKYSVVDQASVVNVKDVVKDKKELALFSPLGCGIQTGTGTVTNAARPGAQDTIVVLGLGGVGLSAVMGAKIQGCRTIVGVDRVASRMQLAKDLGATQAINSAELPDGKSLSDVIKEICDGVGAHYVIDTTGVPALIKEAIPSVRNKGSVIQVGSSPADFNLDINTFTYMITGKTYRGVIEGESYAPEYIPKLIDWYREGKLPIDKLIKFFPAEDFATAVEEMHKGTTIKPVILWD